nr:F-box/kelch-repeat protein At3g61590 [Ipomoea batatas]
MDIFPIDLQEQILALLPFRNILKARTVCKLWNEIVVSKKFQEYVSGGLSKKPWFYMSGNPDVSDAFLYNPVSSKWYCFQLPFMLKHDSEVASSHGLVCYTDYAGDLLVCNLMTKRHKKLALPLGDRNFEYRGLAFSVNPKSSEYTISVVRSMGYDVVMNVYSSETLDKLAMVGGIGIPGRHGVITGIGIWVLKGTEWEEVVRVPPKLLHAFGELDDVFASCGGGDTVYIHPYGGTNTLVFDMNSREWKWARYPLNKKYPLQIFTGFCFYPRLDVSAG